MTDLAFDRPLQRMEHSVARRDTGWFDALFTEHAPAVHRFMVRRADRGEAEDLTADVFVTAWRRRDQIVDGAELPWLYRTAGFVVANHHRKHRATPLFGAGEQEEAPNPQWPDDSDDVREVLAQLSARDQQILLLTAWDGLTADQLAGVLGISRGGADAALSRARAKLRAAWSQVDAKP